MDSQEISATGRASIPEVMISYSSQERPQVLEIVQRLRAAGVAVWIDHGGIDGAQRWGEEIVTAIENCKTVLVMVSRNSMRSENIAKEVSIASDSGKRLLPLYLEEAEIPKSMRYPLSGIQHIKLYDGDPEKKFLTVLRALVRLGIYMSPYYVAVISADAGDRDQAFEWLNKALEARAGGLARLQTEPGFAALRSDARFGEFQKRVESVQLDPEESSAQVPVALPRALTPVAPTGPVPLWKKIFWPDIYDDRSARFAASLGIWTAAFLIIASFLLPFVLTTIVGTLPIMALGWNNPILYAVMFVPIAFGVQKMGRPAAIIGLVLCSLGAIGNLMAVNSMQAAVNAFSQFQNQYGPQFQAQYAAQYQALMAPYYASWFGLIVGAICVLGFSSATRGTLAYHQLVVTRRAEDKQVAITKADFWAIKSSFFATLAKLRGKGQAMLSNASKPSVAALAQPQNLISNTIAPPPNLPVATVPPIPVSSVVAADAPSFAELIGVRGKSLGWLRALAFIVANIASGLTYLLWLTATSKIPVDGVYWQLEIAERTIFAIAALIVFRIIQKPWKASAIAGAAAAVATIPFYSMLPTFIWGDLIYREQFQQFVLVPFFNNFVLLLALAWAVPRVKPMLFALCLGAMSAEVLTPLFANFLRMFGAGQAPDQMLSGTSVIFAVIRSLIFASVFWGMLRLVKQDKPLIPASTS